MLLGLWLCSVASQAEQLTKQRGEAHVLQYHHISTETPAITSTKPEDFKQHMQWLHDNNFQIWPLPKLTQALQQGSPIGDKTVVITFDDCYESVYQAAFPVLKAYNWPFTVFTNTQPIDQGFSSHCSWQQIKEMAQYGATIANHTETHVFLVRRQAAEHEQQWLSRIKAEIVTAEQRIEAETGQSHKLLAYPYGETNYRIQQLIRDLGYVGFGQQSGPIGHASDLTLLPRFPLAGIYAGQSGFEQKMKTRVLPVISAQITSPHEDGILPWAQSQPELTLRIDLSLLQAGESIKRMTCFASGQGRIPHQLNIQNNIAEITVQAEAPLAPGRSRYNCTLPSSQPGHYYWYSQPWLRRGEAERWVHQ